MRHFTALAGLAALLVLGACDTSVIGKPEPNVSDRDLDSDGVPPMTAAEISIYLGGSTMVHEGEDRVWYVYLEPDGRLAGLSEFKGSGATERAHGTWSTRPEGLLCRQWDSAWGGGVSGCARVYQFRDEFMFIMTSGEVDDPDNKARQSETHRRKRVPGNPKSL